MNKKDTIQFFSLFFLVLCQIVFVAFAVVDNFLQLYAMLFGVGVSFSIMILYVTKIPDFEESEATIEEKKDVVLPSYADIDLEHMDTKQDATTIDKKE